MIFQRFEKTDRRIIIVALILLLLSSGLLVKDDWIYFLMRVNNQDLQKIGKVKAVGDDARRRFEVALSWIPLAKSSVVYQGDSIFTGENSTVEIEVDGGEKIVIAPNSLVVINQKKDSVSINIGFGSIESKVKRGKTLTITNNNTVTQIRGSDAAVKIDAGEGSKLVLNVLSGEVRIQSDAGEKLLRTRDVAQVLKTGALDESLAPTIALTAPLADQVQMAKADQPFTFTWSANRKLVRTMIKVAKDADFKNLVFQGQTDDTFFTAYNLPRDTELFWKVVAQGASSRTQRFVVVTDYPPVLITPLSGQHIYFDRKLSGTEAGSSIEFSWDRGAWSRHYELQIAQDTRFTKPIHIIKTVEKNHRIDFLPTGQYFWRVRSIEVSRSRWSATSQFKVGPEPETTLAPPAPLLAENEFEIQTSDHELTARTLREFSFKKMQKYVASFPKISWSAVPNADRYLVQFARDKRFKEIVVSEITDKNYFTWTDIQPGIYYWRVKATSEKFRSLGYTEPQQLALILAPTRVLSKSTIIDEVPDRALLNTPVPPIQLQWLPAVFAYKYEVEFSKSSNFNKATQYFSDDARQTVEIPASGTYYWRWRPVTKSKIPLARFSPTQTFEFQRVYRDPMLSGTLLALSPKQNDSIIIVGSDKSEVHFKWSKGLNYVKYQLDLSTDPEFTDIFFTTKTDINYFYYEGALPTRVVYWRVRGEGLGKKFVSSWTGGNRFLVSYENTPFDMEKSDQMFMARIRARDRQNQILLAREMQIARELASATKSQLIAPIITSPLNRYVIESNLPPDLTPKMLSTQPFEKFYTQVKNYPTIKWDQVPGAEKYVIEIARDSNFEQKVVQQQTYTNFYTWDNVRPGQFYYRIQAFNEQRLRSLYSDIENLQVTVESPITTSLDVAVDMMNEPKEFWQPPSPFTLSWLPVVFARGYEVELSETSNFAVAKVYRTNDISVEINVAKPAMYYWRVRAISEYGAGITEYTRPRSIEVIQAQRSLASLTGLTGLFPVDRTMLFVGEGDVKLKFVWANPQKNQMESAVELSTDKSFKKIVARIKGKNGMAIAKNDLPEGELFWRVKENNIVSAINSFIFKRERSAYVPTTETSASK